jgi:GntR family transcriptional regulator/MocR family aminotransferase
VEAFAQLVAEGFLESRQGASTRVTRTAPDAPPAAKTRRSSPAARVRALPEATATFTRVAAQYAPLPSVPFAISVPAGATAPGDTWRRLGNRLRSRGPAAPAGYADAQGARALREQIARYVRRARSVRCDADQIVITSGTQQGLYLAVQVLVAPDEATWVENPAYPALTAILSTTGRGARMARVPVDDEGLDVERGRILAPHAAAAFVTPSHQYPVGMPMSLRRRTALLDWARASGAWIVEDDYDSEIRYAGHPFPAMQGLEPDRVVYLGTFSKVLFPSLRLGYAIVPADLVQAFVGARILLDRHPPTADQHVLAAFIGEGHLERHIRRLRGIYADQRTHVVEVFDRVLPTALGRVQPCDQGMHMVVWLRDDIDDTTVAAAAAARGVSVRAVSPMYAVGTGRPGLLLGFGGYHVDDIESAARRLATLIKTAAGGRAPRGNG